MKKALLFIILSSLLLNASYLREGIMQYKQQNFKEAFKLFQNAVDEDESVPAYYFLGILYLKGLGTKQDLNKAEKFLRVAAKYGNARANCLLAEIMILKYKNSAKAKKLLKEGQKKGAQECQEIIKKYKISL